MHSLPFSLLIFVVREEEGVVREEEGLMFFIYNLWNGTILNAIRFLLILFLSRGRAYAEFMSP